MKRILSALLAVMLVLGLSACSSHSDGQKPEGDLPERAQQETTPVYTEADFSDAVEDADTEGKPKRLTQIKASDPDGIFRIITFQYDDAGNLISTSSAYLPDGETDDDPHIMTYVYDGEKRLLETFSSFWGDEYPVIKYHYDENGFLTEISGVGEGGGAEGSGVYENDALGRPVVYTANLDFEACITEYTYSEDGQRVSTVETYTHYDGSVSIEYVDYIYTYDAEGRIIAEEMEGSNYTDRIEYSYDYRPFVAQAAPGELPYMYAFKDSMGHEIWSLYTGAPESVETDRDGYLIRIVCNDGIGMETYEFFYEAVPGVG